MAAGPAPHVELRSADPAHRDPQPHLLTPGRRDGLVGQLEPARLAEDGDPHDALPTGTITRTEKGRIDSCSGFPCSNVNR